MRSNAIKKAIAISITITFIISSSGCLEFLFPKEQSISRSEWAFSLTQINELNAKNLTGNNVTIAIVDTGIELSHQDLSHLAERVVWKDFINGKNTPYDDNGHGTHIAGIIYANGKIKGIAWNVKLIVAKALDKNGRGNDNTVAKAIRWTTDPNGDGNNSDGADVITLSLGGDKTPLDLGDDTVSACKEAISEGIFVVAAAGNEGPNNSDVSSPSHAELVISVGAIDENKKIANFSSRGDNDGLLPNVPNPPDNDRKDPNKKPELVAPGVNIFSTWKDNSYATAGGTSQSTAFVSGIIALILEAYPKYQHESNDGEDTIKEFKDAFMKTAEKCPGQKSPHDDRYGYGLIKGKKLLDRLG